MIQFLATNWAGVVSVVSMALAVAVAIAHLAHKDEVAASIQNIEDIVNKLSQPPKA